MKATEARGRTAALPLPPAANYSQTSKKENLPSSGPFALPGGGRDGNMNGKEEEKASEDKN